jgi:hypothetical protein
MYSFLFSAIYVYGAVNADAAIHIYTQLCSIRRSQHCCTVFTDVLFNRLSFCQAVKQRCRFVQAARQVSIESAFGRLGIIANQRFRGRPPPSGTLGTSRGSIGCPCSISSCFVSVPRSRLSSSNFLSGSSSRRPPPAAAERPVCSGPLGPDPVPSDVQRPLSGPLPAETRG